MDSSSSSNNITDNPNQTVYRTDVIVIGSGIAGISAARRLFESGQNVLVLEARPDRMGGRICKSGVFHDLHVDLGASWLHTIKENPLLDYALRSKVEMSLTKNPYLTSSHKFQLFDRDGRPVSDEEQAPVRAKYDHVFQEIAKHLKTLDESHDMSATEAFELIEKKLMDSENAAALESKLTNASSSPSVEAIYHWLKSGIEGFENAKLSQLSARSHFDQEKVFFEGEGFLNGFYRVLEHLAEPLVRAGRVHLGQQVICIDQRNAKSPVAVHTTARTYFCRRVIVAVPLGVLKRQVIEFRPALPESKREAIERIGFGKANKTFFEFDQPFWDPQCYGFGYASHTEDRQFHVFINLMPLYGRPVLFCPAVCATAEWVERASDDEVVDAVLNVLGTIFGPDRASRQHLKRYTITRWASDEFTGGAYSYFAVGTTEKHVEQMAAPFGRVYWAGEHTYEDLGYAHGAAISGLREYDRIMSELRAERDGAVRAKRDARRVAMTAAGSRSSAPTIDSYFTASKL